MKVFMRKIYRLLTSTRLTIPVLFILVFFMILGTIFPQGGTSNEYMEAFGTNAYVKLAPLGVFDIFHSWYFITVAIILYINLFFGTLRGFIVERKKLFLIKEKPKRAVEIKLEGNFSQVENVLRKRRYRYKRVFEDENSISLTGVRGIRKRFISIFFHFFIGISIFGFVLSALMRFDGDVNLKVGDKQYIPRQSKEMGIYKKFKTLDPKLIDYIEVELKNYEMEYIWYRDGYFPKDYKSTLAARYNEDEKMQTVEVNRPLKFKGLTLFQMDYSQEFDIEIEGAVFHQSAGDEFRVSGIDGNFMIRTVYVGKLLDGIEVTEIIPNAKIYFRESEVGRWENKGKLILDEPVSIMGKSMVMKNVKEVSGIYYKRDDGVPFLYFSFLFFMIGLFIRVFLPTFEMRFFYDKNSKNVYIKGSGSGIAGYAEREIEYIGKMMGKG